MKQAIFLLFVFISLSVFSQAPGIEWQNTIGGDQYDYLFSIEQSSDKGYILGGQSYSDTSGDKLDVAHGMDYWIIKIDSLGNIQWQKGYGGGIGDELFEIKQTLDGGYIVGGHSYSDDDFDKEESPVGPFGTSDYWILKLNAVGNIEWQNTIGGTSYEYFESLDITSDGGYILGGWSNSGAGGDKTEGLIGSYDYWIVKLDSMGNIQWDNTIGGLLEENLNSMQETNDGGFILGGSSSSDISGDKTEDSKGGSDYWLLKLNSEGEIQWQKTIGGNNYDELQYVQQTYDNGYFIAGLSLSGISGDKTEGSEGTAGYWVLKLDNDGEIVWQNTIMPGYFTTAELTSDKGYILGGYSDAGIFNDKTESNLGGMDYWVIKIDSLGNIVWQNTIGGTADDKLFDLSQTYDGGYILAGYSSSGISVDKAEASEGLDDYWIIKLACDEGAVFYYDADGDGFGDPSSTLNTCIIPADYVLNQSDCDDTNSAIHPGADEICNSMDDNCNALTDEGLPLYTYYADTDVDGFGDIDNIIAICFEVPPLGYVIDTTDCNDATDLIHPGADEIVCNGIDENCNGIFDEGVPLVYFADADGDSYGDPDVFLLACDLPVGYVSNNSDCDDGNEDINPDATEICNELDDDCDGYIDEDLLTTYFVDADEDGFGNSDAFILSCTLPLGFTENYLDCDDSNEFINPSIAEICNEIDDDCDGSIDDEVTLFTLYIDFDGDNFGNASIDTTSCYADITGYIADSTDCDDTDPDIYPGATEVLDGYDNDCDKDIDEGLVSVDELNTLTYQLFPNPTDGELTLQFENTCNEIINVDVYDLSGRKIFSTICHSEKTLIHLPESFTGLAHVLITYKQEIFEEAIGVF
ncbi:MAG: MopE-related protein [Chitinophagales bacterium]